MKLLTIQDVHVHPKWIEESKRHIKRICEVARSEKVDGITIAGDFFHSGTMANDKGEWPEILQLARDLQSAAQVFYITGTLSHDTPGCYEAFKDIGWKEIGIGKSEVIGDILIMGIPEITPAFILAQSPDMTKMEAIEKQYELVEQIIDNVYVPMSVSHNCPVHFMGHGHVSGAKFKDDQKPRTSEFMYSEKSLGKIKADYYQFGHIHLPQRFKSIPGGYGGSSHITWSDLNFVPGFDIIDYSTIMPGNASGLRTVSDKPLMQRFNYGDLERQKVTLKELSDPMDVRENVNLWIDIECDKSFAEQFDIKASLEDLHEKHNIGPLSKITTNIQRVENVRVETEEYEKCKTLEDLYKIFDPEVNKSTLLKVHEAEQATRAEVAAIKPREFEFLSLYLKGSKAGMENGVKEIKVDFKDFMTGANLLTGPNGTGKSFTLGFMTPFSKHLPTGTDLKSLFELKDSEIVRSWRDGSDTITQKILIDPTLSSPTAKYYMDINGVPVSTVTGNKAPFDDAVNDIFGSIKMFMTCAFRGQKDNPEFPSLENAKESDLRKIFTELSGLDRTPLKNYAHSEAGKISRDLALDERETETLEANKGNKESLAAAIEEFKAGLNLSKKALSFDKESLSQNENKISFLDRDISENESLNKQIEEKMKISTNASFENGHLSFELTEISNTLKNSDSLKTELKRIEEVKESHSVISREYLEESGAHAKIQAIWTKDKENKEAGKDTAKNKAEEIKSKITAEERIINDAKNGIDKLETENGFLNKPCEHCKKLSSDADNKISSNLRVITENKRILKESEELVFTFNAALTVYRNDWKEINDSILPAPIDPESMTRLKQTLDSIKVDFKRIDEIKEILSGLESSENRKADIETAIKTNEDLIIVNNQAVSFLKTSLRIIDMAEYGLIKSRISETSSNIDTNNAEIGRLGAQIESANKHIADIDKVDAKIKEIVQRTEKQQINKSEWLRIEEAFSPKGIPALELSMIAPQIDREANKLLSSYGSRFAVETITQDLDSKGKTMLEKFKILVHDSMASEVKNLPVMSGGQAVWVTKAIQEAISKIAIERTGRNWLYSIMDEADAALDPEAIVSFYEMVNMAMDGIRKLIAVTHSSEAKSCISNSYNITKSFIGYGV